MTMKRRTCLLWVTYAAWTTIGSVQVHGADPCSSGGSPSRTCTVWFLPRGGGGRRGGGGEGGVFATSPLLGKDPSIVQRIQIIGVLQKRPLFVWFQRLVAALVLLTCWQAFLSRGDPWAKAVWELLHPQGIHNNPMPSFYIPSQQDIRIAQALVLGSTKLLPGQQMPGFLPTSLAVIAVILYSMLAFSWRSQQYLAFKPVPFDTVNDNNNAELFSNTLQAATPSKTKLAVLVRVQQCPVQRAGASHRNTKTTTTTRTCPLVPIRLPSSTNNTNNTNKNAPCRMFEFELDKHKFQWNLNVDKLNHVG
jgi:hypothetical protein